MPSTGETRKRQRAAWWLRLIADPERHAAYKKRRRALAAGAKPQKPRAKSTRKSVQERREYRRAWYAERMLDPVFAERRRAKSRATWAAQKADPEIRAVLYAGREERAQRNRRRAYEMIQARVDAFLAARPDVRAAYWQLAKWHPAGDVKCRTVRADTKREALAKGEDVFEAFVTAGVVLRCDIVTRLGVADGYGQRPRAAAVLNV